MEDQIKTRLQAQGWPNIGPSFVLDFACLRRQNYGSLEFSSRDHYPRAGESGYHAYRSHAASIVKFWRAFAHPYSGRPAPMRAYAQLRAAFKEDPSSLSADDRARTEQLL